MTSRTTPVGILVVALAGLIAVGCSAPANAVFQALLDPAGTVAASPEAEPAEGAADGSESSTWWQHPDGYVMVLPAGWSGTAVAASQTDDLIDAVSQGMSGLGSRIEDVIGKSDLRVSAIAADTFAQGSVSPVLLVLAEPIGGRKFHAIKTDVYERISDLPGLTGALSPHDVHLPTAKGVRYDYTIADPDLGDIRVRSFLFRFGRSVYLVNFVASADVANAAGADFDQIADSLHFGV
jgi:hypothetical protein